MTSTVRAASQALLVLGVAVSTMIEMTHGGLSGLVVFTAVFAVAFAVDVVPGPRSA